MTTNIKIYQLKRSLDNYGDLYRTSFDHLKRYIDFNKDIGNYYNMVYEYNINGNNSNDEILDSIYTKFRFNVPDDFNGNRIEVSDLIKINDSILVYDTYGFREIN
jgi:hypothetical protein